MFRTERAIVVEKRNPKKLAALCHIRVRETAADVAGALAGEWLPEANHPEVARGPGETCPGKSCPMARVCFRLMMSQGKSALPRALRASRRALNLREVLLPGSMWGPAARAHSTSRSPVERYPTF